MILIFEVLNLWLSKVIMGFRYIGALHFSNLVRQLSPILRVVVFYRRFITIAKDLEHRGVILAGLKIGQFSQAAFLVGVTERFFKMWKQTFEEFNFIVLIEKAFILHCHDINHVLILALIRWNAQCICLVPSYRHVFKDLSGQWLL